MAWQGLADHLVWLRKIVAPPGYYGPTPRAIPLQRSLLAVVLALAGLCLGLWYWFSLDAVPPAPVVVVENPADAVGNGVAGAVADVGDGPTGTTQRAAAVGAGGELLSDPDIRSAMTGFRGRVLTHARVPVADCGVRIYRLSQDGLLPEGLDLMAENVAFEPRYIGGEGRTGSDGNFLIEGVWPNAIYLLYAGIGTDAPMHQPITRTPSPGEIVDLGDIVLPDAGVIVGRVVNEEGNPVGGALVRAVDLPGTIVSMFPAERIDPEGAILVREKSSPVRVVPMPKWAARLFEDLPIPATKSAADGKFRLVGVVPGSNFFAVTAPGYLSATRASVIVRAGQVKDLGDVVLKLGEELLGKVVDSKGEPVAGAEVFAGSTISLVPVDVAMRVNKTDAQGQFSGMGFAPGNVTVAARRGPGHAWVLAEPQSVMDEVLVTIPATLRVLAKVTQPDGKPCKDARLKLLQGRARDGAAEMAMLGVLEPIDLRDRVQRTEAGDWQISNLLPGRYTLLAEVPGFAVAFAGIDLTKEDAQVALTLQSKRDFVVVVLGPEDKPIANAAVYARGAGRARLMEMPINCGRTPRDGRLVVAKLDSERVNVTAEHPKWGMVHGELEWGKDLVLRMAAPGELRGQVVEAGKAPELGKYTLGIEWRGDGPNGALDNIPKLVSPGIDGRFGVRAMQPGTYRVNVVKALDALRSPGGIMAIAQEMFLANRLPSERVNITSGTVTELTLDTGEKPINGPTASLSGSVMINGRLAEGYTVVAEQNGQRFTARSDARGQYVLALVPAAKLEIALLAPAGDGLFVGPGSSLWSDAIELTSGEARTLDINLNTGSLEGIVTDEKGNPLAGVFVGAHLETDQRSRSRQFAASDAQGRFHFEPVVEGTWSLSASGRGEQAGRGELKGVVLAPGQAVTGLRIEMQPPVKVEGTVDLAVFGAQKPRWAWVAAHVPQAEGDGYGEQKGGFGVSMRDGKFAADDLKPGTYRLRMWGSYERNENQQWDCGEITVPPTGLRGVVLRPVLTRR